MEFKFIKKFGSIVSNLNCKIKMQKIISSKVIHVCLKINGIKWNVLPNNQQTKKTTLMFPVAFDLRNMAEYPVYRNISGHVILIQWYTSDSHTLKPLVPLETNISQMKFFDKWLKRTVRIVLIRLENGWGPSNYTALETPTAATTELYIVLQWTLRDLEH